MKLPSEAVEELDPVFARMAVSVGQRAWGMPGLCLREKALLFLASDVCQQHLDLPLELHLRVALAGGVTFEELREAVRHLAPYAGYPAALRALARVAEIEASRGGREATRGAGASEAPKGAGIELPQGTTERLSTLDPWFAGFVEREAAAAYGRPHLGPSERALLSIAADVCLQTLDAPFALDIALALRGGATPEQVRAAVRVLSEVVGIGRAWAAFSALEQHLAAADAG